MTVTKLFLIVTVTPSGIGIGCLPIRLSLHSVTSLTGREVLCNLGCCLKGGGATNEAALQALRVRHAWCQAEQRKARAVYHRLQAGPCNCPINCLLGFVQALRILAPRLEMQLVDIAHQERQGSAGVRPPSKPWLFRWQTLITSSAWSGTPWPKDAQRAWQHSPRTPSST